MNVVVHNAAFELSFLETIGVALGEVHDTMQAARLMLSEDAMSLEDAVQYYLDVDLDKSHQLSNWAAPVLTAAQLRYAADDVVVLWRLAERILRGLGRQAPAYEIQVAAVPAAMRMKLRGIRMDVSRHAQLMIELGEERLAACEAYVRACKDAGLDTKVPETPSEKEQLLMALLTSEELARWKRTPRSGALSTARSELRRAAHYPPIVALTKVSSIDKYLTSFGPKLTTLVSPVTGRVHANYRVAATASGRASCSKPNLQQIPRDRRFRDLLLAKEGCALVVADYSSMELRAAAHMSRDYAMTKAFEEGQDLHCLTAARMLKKRPEAVSDEERRAAKAVNFGACYGQGARGLVESAWKNSSTLDECRGNRDHSLGQLGLEIV
jgi:DNA polymerase I-like protein with 3'-5' exonuclease and polymerase domains